jgi:hypothetical protein
MELRVHIGRTAVDWFDSKHDTVKITEHIDTAIAGETVSTV